MFERLDASINDACNVVVGHDFALQSEVRQFLPEDGSASSLERIYVAKNGRKYPLIVVVNSDNGVSVLNQANRSVLLAPLLKLLTDTAMLSSLLDGVRSTFKIKG